jgi:hypothetical protein
MEQGSGGAGGTIHPSGPAFTQPTTNQQETNGSSPDPETVFRALSTYPWEQDVEFQDGLSSIAGHADPSTSTGEVDQDLLLQAQCFYFARYEVPGHDTLGCEGADEHIGSTPFPPQ